MAERFGIGKDTVARIWQRHNLKPWTRETFKVSSDPQFEEKPVDVVLDNLSAHKAEPVTRWLDHPKRARWHLQFTPTSSFWQNLVQGWFSRLTKRRLKRGTFTSVDDLVTAIELWAEHWTDDPNPFVWQKPAEAIIARVTRGRPSLASNNSATHH